MHNNKRRQNNMGGGGNGGQHRHHNNRPRRFNNNRPQGEGGGNDPASIARTRRNAIQNREKYQMMARDAQSQGDRVLAENWLQHADHYHRIILSLPPEEAPRPQYLRGHNPNEQQPSQEQQHDGNQQPQQHHQSGDEQPPQQGLPSFITQPMQPGGAEE